MNRNVLIIGGASVLIGGAIAAGAIMNGLEQSKRGERAFDGVSLDMEGREFIDLADEERYSFCQGREEIRGVYENSVFGSEKGSVEFVSEDVSFFDKERNRLYILGRRIEYKYSGNSRMDIASGQGAIDIEESGVTTEYFGKINAPVRIDYNAKTINPAPERKSADWVTVTMKSVGTLMGITDEREDTMTGDAKVFCSGFVLDGAFSSPDYFSFDRPCPDYSPNPGVKFTGNFKFECGGIENSRGIEIAKEYKELEELRNEFDAITDGEGEGGENGLEGAIGEGQADRQDAQRRLHDLRDEIKSAGTELP